MPVSRVCPKCGKRARPTSDLFQCTEHGNVMPAYAYLLNVVVDDGTETIRCVFFRQQADRLIGKPSDEILRMRTNMQTFDSVKNDLLGKIVKLAGKVNKNAMFNRIEFVAQNVDANPDPKEELRRLNG